MTGETPRHRRAPARSEQRAAAAAAAPWAHGARGGLAPPTPQQQQLSGLAALMAQGGPGGGGWATLPPNVLSAVFDSLELKSLAAAASVCTTWRYEASLDARWRAFWQQQVSDVGLWQWAKAAGGHGRAGAGLACEVQCVPVARWRRRRQGCCRVAQRTQQLRARPILTSACLIVTYALPSSSWGWRLRVAAAPQRPARTGPRPVLHCEKGTPALLPTPPFPAPSAPPRRVPHRRLPPAAARQAAGAAGGVRGHRVPLQPPRRAGGRGPLLRRRPRRRRQAHPHRPGRFAPPRCLPPPAGALQGCAGVLLWLVAAGCGPLAPARRPRPPLHRRPRPPGAACACRDPRSRCGMRVRCWRSAPCWSCTTVRGGRRGLGVECGACCTRRALRGGGRACPPPRRPAAAAAALAPRARSLPSTHPAAASPLSMCSRSAEAHAAGGRAAVPVAHQERRLRAHGAWAAAAAGGRRRGTPAPSRPGAAPPQHCRNVPGIGFCTRFSPPNAAGAG